MSSLLKSVSGFLDTVIRRGAPAAKLAAPALYRFGPAAIPLLGRYTSSDDEQLRCSVLHIIERIEYPEKTWDQCTNRMPRVTHVTDDPLCLRLVRAAQDIGFY